MKKFTTIMTENIHTNESMNIISIDNNWLDQAKEDELNRIAICISTGKKQKVYTYKDMLKSLSKEDLTSMNASQTIDKFFSKLGIDKSGAYSIYFDAGQYKIIKWK